MNASVTPNTIRAPQLVELKTPSPKALDLDQLPSKEPECRTMFERVVEITEHLGVR